MSEQVFKVLIKSTEAAGVEIVPTEQGVELIITRKDQAPKKYESGKKDSKSNLERLKEFCSGKKTEEGINKKELKAFWDWYSERAEDWKGILDAGKLWNRWVADK